MRVLFYTHPFFLEPALEFARVMAERTEFHLMLELTPRSLGSLLERTPTGLPAGVIDADSILASAFPPGVRPYWAGARSVRLAVFDNPRTVHPATIPTSLRVLDAIDRLAPDIVHFDDGSLRLAMAFPRLPRIGLMNVHDPLPHGGDANRRIEIGRRLVGRRVDRYRLHAEAFRVAFSDRSDVRPERIDVAPLGVYDVLRAWDRGRATRSARTVLFAGRLAPYKGLDVLYAAAPAVAARVPDVRFVIAGRPIAGYDPPEPPALPHGGRIDVLPGHIANDQLAELHRQAAVVACPYRDATQSGVILTAYAFGTPVVASAVGGVPEQVDDGDSGLLVPPDDPAALADALVRILTDEGLRKRLPQGIDAISTGRLAWTRIADAIAASYVRAADDRG